MTFRSGFIAIIGPPNVGKSTLLNRLLGGKVAIVSPKPQTTRNRILGIYQARDHQIVFIDTPGIHKAKTALHKSMVSSAVNASQEVDLVLLMIEMNQPNDPEISRVIRTLRELQKEAVLVINKIDRGPKERLLPIMEDYRKRYPFQALVPISALKGDGIDILLEEMKTRLKPGPRFYPPDMHTDQPEEFLVSEVIREKLYYHTREELPYSSAVTVDRIGPGRGTGSILSIAARIHVETDSQKRIIIGEGGTKIKEIGRTARLALEKIFGTRVYLELFVRVEPKWTKDPQALRRLGY